MSSHRDLSLMSRYSYMAVWELNICSIFSFLLSFIIITVFYVSLRKRKKTEKVLFLSFYRDSSTLKVCKCCLSGLDWQKHFLLLNNFFVSFCKTITIMIIAISKHYLFWAILRSQLFHIISHLLYFKINLTVDFL